MPDQASISIKQGETLSLPLQVLDPTSLQPCAMAGATVRAEIRAATGRAMAGVELNTIDEARSLFEISAAPATTAKWPAGTVECDVVITWADGLVESSESFLITVIKRVTKGAT